MIRFLLSISVCVPVAPAVLGQSVPNAERSGSVVLNDAYGMAQSELAPYEPEVIPFEHEAVPHTQEVVPYEHEFVPHSQHALPYSHEYVPYPAYHGCATCGAELGCTCGVDLMDVRNFTVLDYRRMFKQGRTPTPIELQGRWRGVNKGLVRLMGKKQFIKEIEPCGSVLLGENVQVHQVSDDLLRCCGWQPVEPPYQKKFSVHDRFVVQPPRGHGLFGKGVVFSYGAAARHRLHPSRLVVDKVVVVDCNHLLGRATVRVGLIHIPVAYFMLERME